MIKLMMRHIEVHLVENAEDQDALNHAGFSLAEVESCEQCFEEVASVPDSKFVPFVVCLDDEEEWIVCATCAEPIL
jgi:hypothetical protein